MLRRCRTYASRAYRNELRHVTSCTKTPPRLAADPPHAFLADTFEHKVDLTVGAYRDDRGEPWTLPSVRMAAEAIRKKKLDKDFPDGGDVTVGKAGLELAFGKDHPWIINGQIACAHTMSGTNSMSIGGLFLSKFYPGPKTIYLPSPTWPNHVEVFHDVGLEVKGYTYLNNKTYGLDLHGMLNDLEALPEMSIVLLHACAHNPTGVDPTPEQWVRIAQAFKKKKLFPFFNMVYQGLASGDVDEDAFALRYFTEQGMQCALSTSFSKNMGLNGERLGAIVFTTDSKEESQRLISQLNNIIIVRYSNPSTTGIRIVREILGNNEIFVQWKKDVSTMSKRLKDMRKKLRDHLNREGSAKNWDHITSQVGLFCHTGLDPGQIDRMIKEHHVYLTEDGRLSVAGLSTDNISRVATALHSVTKNAMDQGKRGLLDRLSFGDFRRILCLGLFTIYWLIFGMY